MADAYDFWAARVPGDRLTEIEAMWARFVQAVPEIDADLALPPEQRSGEVAGLMGRVLGPFAEQLEWEFGPGPFGEPGHTLILTAGLEHKERVTARAVLDNAPDLRGWAFADVRPPIPEPADLASAVADRDGRKFLLAGLDAAVGPVRRIDLAPQGSGSEEALERQAALAFGVLMGDQVAQGWLGRSRAGRKSLLGRLGGRRGAMGGGWLGDLRIRINQLMGEVIDTLPGRPFAEEEYDRARQVMYQANRLENDPGWRHDTITGYTSYTQMTRARMSGDALAGARFSRFGEVFCGLKIARTPDFHFDEFEQRVALSEGAHLMLSSREEGGVTGEAVGRAHVYIDLALTDLSGGMATLAELLDRIELTGPAWLIFDEAGLTDLAIPLTPRTPRLPKSNYD